MNKIILLILLFLITACTSFPIEADPLEPFTKVTYTPPTENNDGTPLTDLTGYKFYCQGGAGDYSLVLDIPDPLQVEILAAPIILLCGPVTIIATLTAYNSILQEGLETNTVTIPYFLGQHWPAVGPNTFQAEAAK